VGFVRSPARQPAGRLAPTDVLVRKLEGFARLSADDRAMLAEIAVGRVGTSVARADLIREGDRPGFVHVILSGWACRYKMLEDGRRQIIAFLLPGDFCDLNVYILGEMDHSIGALTPVVHAGFDQAAIDRIADRNPRLLRALWWEALVISAVQREWTVNLGQRTAFERIAHLFCELFLRLQAIGLTRGDSCELPITQAEIADATGMTPVHVSRTLRDLRAAGLLRWRGRTLTVPDLSALQHAGLFNPNYLHLGRVGSRFDAVD